MDLNILQHYWWILICILGGLLVFLLFVQGGQSLLYTIGKNKDERDLIVNTLGHKWEYTFTTLVVFGGAFFASFPLFYSTSFGGAYVVWMLILFCFVLQAVSYEYRNKKNNFLGSRTYEVFLMINGFAAPLLLGAAVATFFTGSPFRLGVMHDVEWMTPWRGLDALFVITNYFLALAVFFLARTLAALYFILTIDDPNIRRDAVLPRDADPSMFDPEGTWTVARRIVSEITYAADQKKPYCESTVLIHNTESVRLPLRTVTSNEKETAERILSDYIRQKEGDFSFEDSAQMHVHAGTIARYDLQKKITTVPVELHFVRLGSIAFATNPFELFLNYGNRIRARSRARQTFLIQLSNGYYGYLPTATAERGSHYSAYVSSGFAGHTGGDLLVDVTLAELNRMFGSD